MGHPSGFVLDAGGAVKARLASTRRPFGLFHDIDPPRRPCAPGSLGLPAQPQGDAGASVALDPGDLLVLLTDGVIETTSPDDREFGIEARRRQRQPREAVEGDRAASSTPFGPSRTPSRRRTLTIVVPGGPTCRPRSGFVNGRRGRRRGPSPPLEQRPGRRPGATGAAGAAEDHQQGDRRGRERRRQRARGQRASASRTIARGRRRWAPHLGAARRDEAVDRDRRRQGVGGLVDDHHGEPAVRHAAGGIGRQPPLVGARRERPELAEAVPGAVDVAVHAKREGAGFVGLRRPPQRRDVEPLAAEDAEDVGLGEGA
jgi:hypothetical protein